MKLKCILCSDLTTGSIGAAGYHWSIICQPCKDKADNALLQSITLQSAIVDKIFNISKDEINDA